MLAAKLLFNKQAFMSLWEKSGGSREDKWKDEKNDGFVRE